MPAAAPALRIDIDRLLGRLAALAEIGAIEGTEGCARLALTGEEAGSWTLDAQAQGYTVLAKPVKLIRLRAFVAASSPVHSGL